MLFTADAAEAQTLECLKNIYGFLQEIESQQDGLMHSLDNIIKTLEKVTPGDEVSPYFQQKFKNLYHTVAAAATDTKQLKEILRKTRDNIIDIYTIQNDHRLKSHEAGNEEASRLIELDLCNVALTDIQLAKEINRKAVDKINEVNEKAVRLIRHDTLMKMLQNTAQTLPIYVGKVPGAKPPSLCGAIPAEPTYIAKMGKMVAALVKGVKTQWVKGIEVVPAGENWILAKVVNLNTTTTEYEVVEIDMEVELTDHHTLSPSRVVPLPLMRANPETDPHALFAKGSTVMAMYPQTTCFLKAVVERPPTTDTEDYLILFEDSASTTGYSSPMNVAQRYVISIKESKKK